MTTAAPLKTLEYPTGLAPTASIIWMHGLGASATDFVPFVQEVDLASPANAGGVRWVFPNAPSIPVTINGGYVMPAWYDIGHNRSVDDAAGLKRSQASIDALIEREIERGIPANRIVLAGFSQGCAMALMAGLRQKNRLAGVIGCSGYLPLAAEYQAAKAKGEFSANAKTPVLLMHGRVDDVVPLARGTASRDALLALGHTVQWIDYAMPHSVVPQQVRDVQTWLRTVLGV